MPSQKPLENRQDATWLRVHDWKDWQTYRRDRSQPPWIKIHRCLMRDWKWIDLSDAERGQLVAMWLLAADHDGAIPASPRRLMKLCHMEAEPNLSKFIGLGLLDASVTPSMRRSGAKPTPSRRQHDQADTEVDTDTEGSFQERDTYSDLEIGTEVATGIDPPDAPPANGSVPDDLDDDDAFLVAEMGGIDTTQRGWNDDDQ